MFVMLTRNGGGLVAPKAFKVLSRLATAESSMRDTGIIFVAATVFPSHFALTLEFWASAIRA